jgi:putative hydrolase of the HAD superfamily
MMKIQAVIFDLGETLLNYGRVDVNDLFRQGARLSYDYLRERHPGSDMPGFTWYYLYNVVSIKAHYFWSNIVQREFDCLKLLGRKTARLGFHLDEKQIEELAYLWYKHLGDCAVLEPGLHDTLNHLLEMGLRLAILSNTFLPAAVLDRHLTKYDLLEYFSVRVYSSDTVYRKPDGRIYQRVLTRLGLPAAAAVMVGDRVREDIRGARKAGIRSVLKRGPYTRQRLCPDSVPVIDRIADLPTIIREWNS